MASSGERTGVLLHRLQCAGQPPAQRIILPKMPIVPRLRTPELVSLRIWASQEYKHLYFQRKLPLKLCRKSGTVFL